MSATAVRYAATPTAAADTTTPTVSGLPTPVNLALYQGDDFYMDLTVDNPDGTPADLTGAVASALIRSAPGAADPPMATITATVDVALSVVHLHLPHTEAANLAAGGAAWDCQIATPDVTTLAAGRVTVTAQVTP